MENIECDLKDLEIGSGLSIIKNNLKYRKMKYSSVKQYQNLLEITRRITHSNYKKNLTKVAIYSGNYTLKNDSTPEEPWFNIPINAFDELKEYSISYVILSVIYDYDDIESYLLPVDIKLDKFLVKYMDMDRNRYVFALSSLKKAIDQGIEGYILCEEQLLYFIESIKNIV